MQAIIVVALLAQPAEEGPRKPDLDPFIAKAIEPAAGDSELRKLQKERVRERAEYLDRTRAIIEIGRWDASYFQETMKTQVVLAENLAELMDKPADKLKCYEMRVDILKKFEQFIDASVRTDNDPPQNL